MTYLFHHMIILLFFSFFVFFFFFLFFIIFSFFFFFPSRRRHTRLTCYWSSDVCSSDLEFRRFRRRRRPDVSAELRSGEEVPARPHDPRRTDRRVDRDVRRLPRPPAARGSARMGRLQIGRASCRERAGDPLVAGPLGS